MTGDISKRKPVYKKSAKRALKQFLKNYHDKEWWRTQFRARLVTPTHEVLYGYEGVDIMSENWDNIIILDACRADLFEEVVDINQFDEYERKISRASNTTTWTRRNFANKSLGDTVYVSASPVTSKVAPNSFYRLLEVWGDLHNDNTNPPTHDETGQILPEHTANRAIHMSEEFPNKRLIVHFIPPHIPFLNYPELIFNQGPPPGVEINEIHEQDPPKTVWEALRMGIVSRADVWEGYADNLRIGFSNVMDLVNELDGRTVITSDHGNLLGERSRSPIKFYGHPPYLRSPELIEVPWGVLKSNEQRKITDEKANSMSRHKKKKMESQLRNLGYFN